MESNFVNSKIIRDVLYLYECQRKPIITDDKVTLQKEKVKNVNQNREERCRLRLEEYNRRIDKLQKQNVISKLNRQEANRQKELRIRNRLSDMKTLEHFKNINLIKSIKDKETKSQKLLAERKNLRSCRKQDGKCFRGDSNCPNKSFVDGQLLSDKRSLDNTKHVFSKHEEETDDEHLEEMNEEECFTDSDQSKLEAINLENFDYLRVYLERIAKFKKQFGSCETGTHFLKKTAPIWDSLTQCIYRKSMILRDMAKDSEDNAPEEYRKIYNEADNYVIINKQSRALRIVNTWLLETLNMDLDYEISGADVYKAITKAKGLASESALASEIMRLVKYVLEHEVDVNRNVQYVCRGLCRKTVFEHVKRRMSHRILERSQNTIDRLRGKIDSIPKRLLALPDGDKLVEPMILAFIADSSSPHGDTADSMDAVTAYANAVRDAMRAFSKTTRASDDRSPTMMIDCEGGRFVMPGKNHVEKHVDTHVDRLMAFVGKRLASNMSKKSFAPVRAPPRGRLTSNKFVVLARKITKIVFDMDYDREERIYVLDVIMSKIVGEIVQRCPRVQYKKKRNTVAVDR